MDIIDFHSHILPGADHGSDNLETSKKQLQLLHEVGVKKVVATPHFYPDRTSVDRFLKLREHTAEKLATLEEKDLPEVFLGAEVLVYPGLDHMPDIEKLCIYGTNVILLEMPFFKWREEYYETVYNISKMDFVVVMAHIGRYPSHSAMRLVNESNVLVQLNAEDVTSFKGRKKAKKWIETDLVTAIGSDIHDAEKSYSKNLARMAEFVGESTIKKTNGLLEDAIPLNFCK